jgi:hypothetical protein
MKITSRRFGRSTAHENVDEGMGGGDYPTVVSDLSVHPEVQVIPEQVYPELPQAPEPAYDGAEENFWGSVGTEPDKTHRWRRPKAEERVEEAQAPGVVIIPDVTVEPPLQVIPDIDSLRTQAYQPPNDGDDGNFWSSVGTEPEKAPRPWWRRRTTYIVTTVLVTVVALVVSLIAFSGPQVKNKRISYTFPVEAFPQTGVTVSRTWTLYGGQHPSLHGDLTFYSSRSDQVTVEEVLPSSLVSQASQVTFIPKPKIVGTNPVVASYSISSALDGVTSAEYTIPLPTTTPYTLAVLHKWAAEQSAQSGQRYLRSHTLESIHLTPASIVVKKGGAAYQLAISGLQQDGTPAPTIAFGTAKWSVADPKIAKVSSKGQVTGLVPGKTTVRAVIGKLSATATVTVSAAANVKGTPPLKPLKADGLLNLTPESFPTSIGVLSNGPTIDPVTGKPVVKKPSTGGSKPPVVVQPPPVNPPPPVCPTAPPAPSEASVFPTSDTSVAVSWGAANVPTGCGFTLSGYAVSGTDGAGAPLSAIVPAGGSSTAFANLPAGAVSVSVVASYGAVNSAAVGASTAVNGPPAPPPPPPPTCTTAQEIGPSGLAASAPDPVNSPDTFTFSWTSASVDPASSCTVTVESANVDGAAVTNGSQLLLAPGPHTLTVTATFGDGTTQSPQFSFTAP